MLNKSVDAGFKIVFPKICVDGRLYSYVVGRLIYGCDHGIVVRATFVVGGVVVIKGRNCKQAYWD